MEKHPPGPDKKDRSAAQIRIRHRAGCSAIS
jgi:hypothetical protein